MKRKLISVTALFSALMIIAAGILYFSQKQSDIRDNKAEQLVAVNEIKQLAKMGEYEKLSEKTEELSESIRSVPTAPDVSGGIFVMCGICIVFCGVIFGYVYFAVLRPFDKLKSFAEKISQGNFDIPLEYERSNYFGEFTWAFDSMRREITKARSCEREAVENNKTVIATLSHDIKTPIASIRAYAEGLEANLDGTPEKRRKYLGVIMKKCDEVSRLTNDLFLHSLSDMDKLKIIPETFELCGFIENAVNEIAAEHNDVHFRKPDFTAAVSADKNRLMQITENLINNARKYAKTDIDIFITQSEGNVLIHFRDHGKGIPDEDMPFIFGKFYRGKNCGNEQGSGLGLYIVKYITEQQNGNILLQNHNDGLEATVSLPIIRQGS
ncbi:MAG: ATP-binding protein [Huintestinicola sp.]|uniref:HAMP domain-containing sensor histidine kinase n=1 Tax=Huintestinicola sp. TaxID=2981661 RepID=UPI003F09E905